MTDIKYMCPDCGSIDLIVKQGAVRLLDAAGAAANTIDTRCPNCDWTGDLSQTIGAVMDEGAWDVERISKLLLRLVTSKLAGPLMQAFTFIGLVKEDDQDGKDYIMQMTLTAMIETAFTAAHDVYLKNNRVDLKLEQAPRPPKGAQATIDEETTEWLANVEEAQKPHCPNCDSTTIKLSIYEQPLHSPQNRAECRNCAWTCPANKLVWPYQQPAVEVTTKTFSASDPVAPEDDHVIE